VIRHATPRRTIPLSRLRPTPPSEEKPDPRGELASLRSRVSSRATKSLVPPLLRRPLGPGLYEVIERIPDPSGEDVTLSPLDALVRPGRSPSDLFRVARANLLSVPYELHPHGLGKGRFLLRVVVEDGACPAALALELGRRLPVFSRTGFLFAAPAAGVAAVVPLRPIERPIRCGAGVVPIFPGPQRHFRPLACAHALATFAIRAHALLPAPFTPEIFWVHDRRLAPVPTYTQGREHRVLPTGRLAGLLHP